MKIPSSLNTPAAGTGSVSDRPAAAKPSGDDTPPVASGNVRLSELSAQLASAVPGPDFDHAKVEVIKQAIADGKLQVNAENVADRLIANALALQNQATK
jgi:flagellar biosynthesis anti-sigma factor FlgM